MAGFYAATQQHYCRRSVAWFRTAAYMHRLRWTQSLRQQNLAARGRDDVPDGLLFADAAAKAEANAFPEEWKRYGFGLAIVESKRWQRPLDRQSGRRGEETAPSTQMLRYLRRVEDLTTGKLRWGILTNGARWRLYYQGARSVSEQFFGIDLAAVLAIPGHEGGLFALTEDERRHWLGCSTWCSTMTSHACAPAMDPPIWPSSSIWLSTCSNRPRQPPA